VHEVLQLFVDEEADATRQQRLKMKHLALDALHHSDQLDKSRLLFWRVVVPCCLHIWMKRWTTATLCMAVSMSRQSSVYNNPLQTAKPVCKNTTYLPDLNLNTYY